MRGWISWAVRAFLILILFLVPPLIVSDAYKALPHDRALANAYAASPGCQPSTLLHAPPLLAQRAPSTAQSGTLCEVRRMTVQDRRQSHGVTFPYHYNLSDEAGKSFYVSLDNDSWRLWRDLRSQGKVNAQLVEGNVTMISDGANLARTGMYPQHVLHSFSVKLYFAGVLFLLFFALLGLSVRAWVKKARRTSSGAAELSEAEARGSSDPPGADSPALECPNFQGRPLAQAREDLEAAGYKLGRISFIASSSSAVGVVVAQTPPPGSKVTRGTVVKFQVSITAKTGSSNF